MKKQRKPKPKSRRISKTVKPLSLTLRNLLFKVRESTWNEKEIVYEVEPELIEWAHLHAKFYIQRYKEGKGNHWGQEEKRTDFVGLIGQKIFDLMLQQLAVPKDHNDPVLDWRLEKDYDFNIANFGTIEAKCFDHNRRKVLVKLSEWHGNDYLVVFKLQDKEPKTVNMMGYLTRKEVEKLPISRKGEVYTPYADAYICDFDELNPSNKFIKMLECFSLK